MVRDKWVQRHEYMFRGLFDEAPIGIAVEDLDGNVLLVNPALCALLGYDRDELQRMSCAQFDSEDSDDWALFQKLRAGVIPRYSVEKRYVRGDGTPIWGRLNVCLLKRSREDSPRVLALLEDITAHKQALETRSKYGAVAECSDDAVISATLDGVITDWSAGALRLFGYTETEAVGQPITMLVPPELQGENAKLLHRLGTGEHIEHQETVRIAKDGRKLIVLLSLSPVRDSAGAVVGLSGVARDMGERKRSEKSLRESEEKFRRIFREAGVGMAIFSLDGRFLSANNALCEFLGHSENELLGKTVQSVTHPADWPVLSKRLGQAINEGTRFKRMEKRCLHKSGRVLTSDTVASLVRDTDGKPLYFIAQAIDVTERKKAEEALRHREQDLVEAQRVASVGSWQWNPNTDEFSRSPEFCRITGCDPNVAAPRYQDLSRVLAAETWNRLQHAVEKTLSDGSPYELDGEVVQSDGTTRWVTMRGEPHRDPSGSIVLLRGTMQDITDRKRAEKELADLSARFVSGQEEERSHLARELHDDVSQRLALIVVTLDRLRENPPDSTGEIRTALDDLFERIADVSSDIHRLSHRLHPATLSLGLAPGLRSLSMSMERQHGLEIATVFLDLPDSIPRDISLCLYRVAQEALNNVVKHSGVKQARLELVGSAGSLVLRVMDSGRGFDWVTGSQTGLGLLSMRERLRLVGGSFAIHSQPSQGTQVVVTVPIGQSALRFPAAAGA
jgi:PAS domain S-box-containing protein